MASQRPLVMINGQVQQLAAGDTLVGAGAAAFYATMVTLPFLTDPAPTVFCSSQYTNGGSYGASALYNGVNPSAAPGDGWTSSGPFSAPEWNCRILPSAVTLRKYALQPTQSEPSRMAKSWTFSGSNDTSNGADGTWTVLDTRTDEPLFSGSETRTFIIQNPAPFIAHKITVTAIQGPPGEYLRIGELLESYLVDPPATPTDTISCSPPAVAANSPAGTPLGSATTTQAGPNTWYAKGATVDPASGALTSSQAAPASGTFSFTVYADNGTTVVGEKITVTVSS